MSDKVLKEIMRDLEALSLEEQLRLAAYLVARIRTSAPVATQRGKLTDLVGAAKYPALGEDAQAWISRTRQESDEGRGA
jgi:hypothetical protein